MLQKVERENKDGNFERAAQEVEIWLGFESDSIAELCCRAAKWRLAFADSDHDERLALTDALKMANAAANLSIENQDAHQIVAETNARLNVLGLVSSGLPERWTWRNAERPPRH